MALGTKGLQTSIWNNNLRSVILLVMFPIILAFMSWGFLFAFHLIEITIDSYEVAFFVAKHCFYMVIHYFHFIAAVFSVWYLIAFFANQSMMNRFTGAKRMERSQNPEIYNLLENLCISQGIATPSLCIISSDTMNAYASGINQLTYTITITQGLIDNLDKKELEAVLAHELSHILNRDARLLIIAIIFVGIISVFSEVIVRNILNRKSSSTDKKPPAIAIIIVLTVAFLGYLFSILIRFALSRRREYIADAGAIKLTQNPEALIGALQKISGNSNLEGVDSEVKQIFFDNESRFLNIFSTHPTIKERIDEIRRNSNI